MFEGREVVGYLTVGNPNSMNIIHCSIFYTVMKQGLMLENVTGRGNLFAMGK